MTDGSTLLDDKVLEMLVSSHEPKVYAFHERALLRRYQKLQPLNMAIPNEIEEEREA